MIHGLYIALRAHHPKSNHRQSPWIWPLLPPRTLPPLPVVITLLLSVPESQLHTPHECNGMVLTLDYSFKEKVSVLMTGSNTNLRVRK